MKHIAMFCLLGILLPGMTALAAPYDGGEVASRLDELERLVRSLQRDIYNNASQPAGAGGGNGVATAELGVRLSQIEEQLRSLRGELEENHHAVTRVSQEMKALSEDVDYRLRALEQGGAAQPGALPGAMPPPSPRPQALAPLPAPTPAPQSAPAQDAIVAAAEGSLAAPPPSVTQPQPQPQSQPFEPSAEIPAFSSPKELYNYGFTLMNKAQYATAGDVFQTFIVKYPKDPLIGNVYYWLGETYYVREDYLKAANSFRQGFEAMPTGVKAPDNLLKLSKALSMLGKQDQACVVLKQLLVKFEGGNEALLQKARRERETMQCKP